MGFPVLLDDVKFKRNFYLFNVCFIFDEDTDVFPFEAVLRKLAHSLRIIEVIAASSEHHLLISANGGFCSFYPMHDFDFCLIRKKPSCYPQRETFRNFNLSSTGYLNSSIAMTSVSCASVLCTVSMPSTLVHMWWQQMLPTLFTWSYTRDWRLLHLAYPSIKCLF